ncbi:hypothetical protein LWI28_011306 [Acer negundo]|uniref:Anaphase-promoting complex subunit 4-like WD40 domain-containing protein n=1 Tax=Acer negundo TaxID=4023 RepID=A0AAD5P553_ACENE|nr:hypothetical protein LWI28_011306 [Acer negundo]
MDFDFAHYMLNHVMKKVRGIDSCFGMSSLSREAYRRQLAEIFNMNHTRILAFKNRPSTPIELIPQSHYKPTCSPLLHHSTNALFLSWAPDGRHIAVGWNNSQVQIWDSTANRKLRTLRGGHRSGVGSMAWNNHILTTGGHTHEVCGLKWSPSGQQLANGGGDHLLHIWDTRSTQWLHSLEELLLMPRLFFGVLSGEICWKLDKEALLVYPSKVKATELTGHTSRVRFIAQSSDGCTVASAAAGNTLRIWNSFGDPEVAKFAPKAAREPFAHFSHIR